MPSLVWTLCLFLWCCHLVHTDAVIGIDMGSESIKVGLLKRGSPINIVENEQSSRKTPAAVAFINGDRFVGAAAEAMSGRYPELVFNHWKSLMRNVYSASQKEDLDMFTTLLNDTQRGTVSYLGENDEQHSVEEVLTMLFQHVRRHAEKQAKQAVRSCVITVPPFFSQLQRRIIIDTATIAGLDVLSLMNENLAAAVQYGVSKRDVIQQDMKKHKTLRKTTTLSSRDNYSIVLFDMGLSSLTVSVVSYLPKESPQSSDLGQIIVRGVAWDNEHLGGEEYDKRIARFLADKFAAQHPAGKYTPLQNVTKSWAKLRKAAKKAKEVLSVNTEAPVSVESIIDDVDFKSSIKRSEFLELCEDLNEKILKVLDAAMKRSQLSIKDITSLEIIGGGSRIPSIQKLLSNYFGRSEVNRSLNSDEAVATGSTLQAAKQSKKFVIKNFAIQDVYHPKILLSIDQESNRYSLFNFSSNVPAHKTVVLSRSDNFNITVLQQDAQLNSTLQPLISYQLTDVSDIVMRLGQNSTSEAKPEIKVIMDFNINLSGVIHLSKATVSYVDFIIKKPTAPAKKEPSPKAKDAQDTATKPEKRTRNKEIRIVTQYLENGSTQPLTKTQQEYIKQTLKKWDDIDLAKRKLAKAKNELEAKIYELKDRLTDDEWDKYFSQKSKSHLLKTVETIEDWLTFESDAQNIKENHFTDRLKTLNLLSEKPYQAAKEFKTRQPAIKKCLDVVKNTQNSLPSIKNTGSATEQEINALALKISQTDNWITNIVSDLEKSAVYDQPKVVTTAQLESNCTRLSDLFTSIKNKPKPKPNTTRASDKTKPKPTTAPKTTSSPSQPKSESSTPHDEL